MAQVVSSDVKRLTLSVEEAAQMLGISRALAYDLSAAATCRGFDLAAGSLCLVGRLKILWRLQLK